MEQLVRDTKIACIYEGTTGIQALDLLGRKVLMTQGASLRNFTKQIHKFCQAEEGNAELAHLIKPLAEINKEWGDLTMKIGMAAMKNRDEVGSASVDYLMYSGYAVIGTCGRVWPGFHKTHWPLALQKKLSTKPS